MKKIMDDNEENNDKWLTSVENKMLYGTPEEPVKVNAKFVTYTIEGNKVSFDVESLNEECIKLFGKSIHTLNGNDIREKLRNFDKTPEKYQEILDYVFARNKKDVMRHSYGNKAEVAQGKRIPNSMLFAHEGTDPALLKAMKESRDSEEFGKFPEKIKDGAKLKGVKIITGTAGEIPENERDFIQEYPLTPEECYPANTVLDEDMINESVKFLSKLSKEREDFANDFVVHTAIGTYRNNGNSDITIEQLIEYNNGKHQKKLK